MATREQYIAWALSQVGTVEKGGPHGNDGNIVPYWDLIHHHEEQGCPWCAAFTEAGDIALGMPVIVDSQYCPTVEAAYRRAGRLVSPDKALPGDQGFLHFAGEANEANHTVVCYINDPSRRQWRTIEGNTSSGVAGSQSDGGGVYIRTRSYDLFRDVGQPTFTIEGVAVQHNPAWVFRPVVADCPWPGGGTVMVADNGDVYATGGAPDFGKPGGQPYFVNHHPATVVVITDPAEIARCNFKGPFYRIKDTENHDYDYGPR